MQGWNKHIWTVEEINFIKKNFFWLTNKQLADGLGMKLTSVRTKCYELGLKRMDLEYWTEEQVQFLRDNYKHFGDKELAEIFATKWHKNKSWSRKHIEKKRRYLKLKRTAEHKRLIKVRECKKGTYSRANKKMWIKRGVAPEGEIRYWQGKYRIFPVIKINGRFIHWNRWIWEQHNGKVPNGYNIIFKDHNPYNLVLDNLEMVSNSRLATLNSIHRYPEDVKSAIRLVGRLNKIINKKLKNLGDEK